MIWTSHILLLPCRQTVRLVPLAEARLHEHSIWSCGAVTYNGHLGIQQPIWPCVTVTCGIVTAFMTMRNCTIGVLQPIWLWNGHYRGIKNLMTSLWGRLILFIKWWFRQWPLPSISSNHFILKSCLNCWFDQIAISKVACTSRPVMLCNSWCILTNPTTCIQINHCKSTSVFHWT